MLSPERIGVSLIKGKFITELKSGGQFDQPFYVKPKLSNRGFDFFKCQTAFRYRCFTSANIGYKTLNPPWLAFLVRAMQGNGMHPEFWWVRGYKFMLGKIDRLFSEFNGYLQTFGLFIQDSALGLGHLPQLYSVDRHNKNVKRARKPLNIRRTKLKKFLNGE